MPHSARREMEMVETRKRCRDARSQSSAGDHVGVFEINLLYLRLRL